jgi:hypothetical protein
MVSLPLIVNADFVKEILVYLPWYTFSLLDLSAIWLSLKEPDKVEDSSPSMRTLYEIKHAGNYISTTHLKRHEDTLSARRMPKFPPKAGHNLPELETAET